ncbi:MAG: FAD-dependent oxidoreductase [Oscillospiraceae bacterium]|nr:FAD-dependent oxidoreductase [Oscillospiraceae bacterium]
MYDIIIVGAGPAGLTAAIYALRAGKTALVIEKNGFGGQIAYSPKVENIPGIASISGAQFADDLTSQAMALGAEMELECVVDVVPTDRGFEVKTEEGSIFAGRSVILATGVKHRTLGLPGEEMLIGSGLSFCAVCDGAFYAGGKVVMVGGGNSALQEALLLSDICAHVTVVQNLPYFTGEKKLADALMQKENVTVLFDSLVTGYLVNEGALSGVTVQRGEDTQNIMVDGAFLAVGLVPENDAFAHLAGLNTHGYFDSGEDCMTATPGLFVAGDCRSKNIRQVVTAAADGAAAATAACRYIDSL